MTSRLKELKKLKGQFRNGAELSQFLLKNSETQNEIRVLSKYFLDKPVEGCSNCYFDAFVNLMKLDENKAKEKSKSLFEMKRGKLLRDIDTSKNMTYANTTNDLAIYHLKKNPKNINFFSKYPENWEEILETGIVEGDSEKVITPGNPKGEEVIVEFSDSEKVMISEMKELLLQKLSKTKIGAKYAGTMVDGKKLNGKRIGELIKEASKTES